MKNDHRDWNGHKATFPQNPNYKPLLKCQVPRGSKMEGKSYPSTQIEGEG